MAYDCTVIVVARELADLAEAVHRKRVKFERVGDREAINLAAFLEKFVRGAAEAWSRRA